MPACQNRSLAMHNKFIKSHMNYKWYKILLGLTKAGSIYLVFCSNYLVT